jgi:hypothetical protein
LSEDCLHHGMGCILGVGGANFLAKFSCIRISAIVGASLASAEGSVGVQDARSEIFVLGISRDYAQRHCEGIVGLRLR